MLSPSSPPPQIVSRSITNKILLLLSVLPVIIVIFIKLIQSQLSLLEITPFAIELPELPSFNPDNRLANVMIEKLGEDDLIYPESFVVSPDKKYAFISLGDGRIVRLNEPSNKELTWQSIGRTGADYEQCGKGGPADDNNMEEECGRPLGLWLTSRSSVDKTDNVKDEDVLLVADSYKGFLMVTGIYEHSSQIHTLASRALSDPPDYTFKLLNAAVQVDNGDIYLTETTQQFGRRRIFYAALDGNPTGRILRYRPSGVVEVVAENIYMPNGITLSHDGQSLLIVCGVRILRFDLHSQRLDPKPFVDVMPGTGDNIKTMYELPNGKKVKCYYAALGGTYKKPFSLLKYTSDKVWLKSLILALVPYRQIINLIPKWTALVVFDENGNIIETLTDDGTQKLDGRPLIAPWISEVEPVGEYLYLSSWFNPFLARMKRKDFE